MLILAIYLSFPISLNKSPVSTLYQPMLWWINSSRCDKEKKWYDHEDTVISSKIGFNLLEYWLCYITCAVPRSLFLTINRSNIVTSMETPVFNSYCHTSHTTTPFRHTRCFSFPRLFFSVYLVPSPITSTIPIVVNLSETFGKLAVIAGRWAGPYELDERREESERWGKRRRWRRRGRDAVENSSLTV